ncbi:MAG: hypothetical protein OK454_02100 [Thaumarchaeota archaeon]|nr:hypothetical protein [Nitrososphaerota archaeon]
MISNEIVWMWAQRLYTRWHSAHGLSASDKAWAALDEWEKGYWHSVAEFVLEYFEEEKR